MTTRAARWPTTRTCHCSWRLADPKVPLLSLTHGACRHRHRAILCLCLRSVTTPFCATVAALLRSILVVVEQDDLFDRRDRPSRLVDGDDIGESSFDR
uniref:Uncharacterized protein n=1 Tax=Plectus sambesii TaxID=2011161 RepID=A0A914X6L3_9BILA